MPEIDQAKSAHELFDAVGELALAIKPHSMDRPQMERIRSALHVLVDHIIAIWEARAKESRHD